MAFVLTTRGTGVLWHVPDVNYPGITTIKEPQEYLAGAPSVVQSAINQRSTAKSARRAKANDVSFRGQPLQWDVSPLQALRQKWALVRL